MKSSFGRSFSVFAGILLVALTVGLMAYNRRRILGDEQPAEPHNDNN